MDKNKLKQTVKKALPYAGAAAIGGIFTAGKPSKDSITTNDVLDFGTGVLGGLAAVKGYKVLEPRLDALRRRLQNKLKGK